MLSGVVREPVKHKYFTKCCMGNVDWSVFSNCQLENIQLSCTFPRAKCLQCLCNNIQTLTQLQFSSTWMTCYCVSSGTFNIGRKDRLWKNYHRLMLKHGKTEVCSQTNKLANDEKYWTPIFQFGFLPRTFCLPADTKLLRKVTPAYFFPHPMLSWPGVGEERRQRTVDCEASCYGSWLWHQGESLCGANKSSTNDSHIRW